jgi:hypothetical protein
LRNVSGLLGATGKWRMLLRNRGVEEMNLEFGAGVGHFEHL